jgi:hypothetical protein
LVLTFAAGNGQTGPAGYGQVLILDGQTRVTGPGITSVSISNVLGQPQTVTATCGGGSCVVPAGQAITFTVALRGAVGGPVQVSLGSILLGILATEPEFTGE